VTDTDLNTAEQLARIEREHAHARQLQADAELKMQDFGRLNMLRFYVQAVTAAAGILGAGAALGGVVVALLLRH